MDEREIFKSTFEILLERGQQIEKTKDIICECYCKFPEEYRSMYKDVDEAQDNLEREKCDMCPLNKLI